MQGVNFKVFISLYYNMLYFTMEIHNLPNKHPVEIQSYNRLFRRICKYIYIYIYIYIYNIPLLYTHRTT